MLRRFTKHVMTAIVLRLSAEQCEDQMHKPGSNAYMACCRPLLLLVALSLPAHAGDAGSSEGSRYEACMESSGGVTADMLNCTLAATDEVQAEIDLALKEANLDLAEEQSAALGEAHSDWTRFRKSTCEFEAGLAGDGSFTSVALADCWLRLTQERLQWLRSHAAREQ
ncbi:MAG: lysozyme inhibitor LprI family protein [Allorhizobium sp.]